mmetsp:Transcript_19650/g.59433  ORF Transcript_19650/g.59433 Transcript_19650/m.59433 type:complete len:152 (-) Transcript_19650:1348-1803(-)
MGDLRGWGSADDGRSPSQEPNDAMMGAFESCQVYLGGIYAPNRLIQQKSIFLHGQADLPGSQEVSPGIYTGGRSAAAARVLEGEASPQEFKFFAGSIQWTQSQLDEQVAGGVWTVAACSRSVAIKQCLQLPVPLWVEVQRLMGVQIEMGDL